MRPSRPSKIALIAVVGNCGGFLWFERGFPLTDSRTFLYDEAPDLSLLKNKK